MKTQSHCRGRHKNLRYGVRYGFLAVAMPFVLLVAGCGNQSESPPLRVLGEKVVNEVLMEDPPLPAQAATFEDHSKPNPLPAKPLPGEYCGFEPSVAADGHGRVVVAAMDFPEAGGPTSRMIHWQSKDRGQTWSEAVPFGPWPPRSFLCDPWLQNDARGRSHIVYIAHDLDKDEGGNFLQQSIDGGQTWEPPIALQPPGDRTVLSVSPAGDRLVFAASATMLESRARGESWRPVPLPFETGPPQHLYFDIVADDHAGIAAAGIVIGPDSRAGKVVLFTTNDAGKNWRRTKVAPFQYDPQQENPYRYVGTAICRDGNGNLHAGYTRPRNHGTTSDVLLRTSSDYGSWSGPVAMADDRADWRGFPAIAAGGSMVHVAWIEKSGSLRHVIYRRSSDSGKTWSDRLLLSRPESPDHLMTDEGFARPFGDYMSLADDGRRVAYAVWGVANTKSLGKGLRARIWYAIVR